MTSRLDEIKARHELANSQPITDLRVWDSVFDVPRLVAALESVLELHEPEATGYGDWVCGACISAGSHDWESTAYPCPTVAAIQSALREVGK